MLWYSLKALHWGASNEYPQHMFSWRNKKNINLIPTLIKAYAKTKKTGSGKLGNGKLQIKFESLRREIKADIKKQHDLYVNNLVGDVKVNLRDFYRYINSQKKDRQGIPPLNKGSGEEMELQN